MKFEYISPIIEMIDIYNDEQILAGSQKATDGFGNDGDNPDKDYSMKDVDGDQETLSKDNSFEW